VTYRTTDNYGQRQYHAAIEDLLSYLCRHGAQDMAQLGEDGIWREYLPTYTYVRPREPAPAPRFWGPAPIECTSPVREPNQPRSASQSFRDQNDRFAWRFKPESQAWAASLEQAVSVVRGHVQR
jgi:hypothetical protein